MEPSGTLRISVGTLYAHYRLLPVLPEFTATFPQIDIELSLSNKVTDMVDEGYDLAIRIGTPPDSRLIAQKLEDATVGVFATPGYLAQHGTPQTLESLTSHQCLQFILPTTGRPMPWILRTPDGDDLDHVLASGRRVLDDASGAVAWGMAGGGIFQTYHFIAAPAVARGELIEVLQAYGGRSRQFSITFPQNRHLSARVRVFVDFMLQRLRIA